MSEFVSLCQNTDFHRLYGRGKSRVHPALVSYVLKNRVGFPRVGITTSKKIGNAVTRNRARRVIRAAFTPLAGQIRPNTDIVFVARSRTAGCKSDQLERIMREQLQSLGVLP